MEITARRGINRGKNFKLVGKLVKHWNNREGYRKLKVQAQRKSRQAYNNYVHDIISQNKPKTHNDSGHLSNRKNKIIQELHHYEVMMAWYIMTAIIRLIYSIQSLNQHTHRKIKIVYLALDKVLHQQCQTLTYLVKAFINYSQNSRYIKQQDLTQSHHDTTTPSLTRIYQTSLDTGTVPTDRRTKYIYICTMACNMFLKVSWESFKC